MDILQYVQDLYTQFANDYLKAGSNNLDHEYSLAKLEMLQRMYAAWEVEFAHTKTLNHTQLQGVVDCLTRSVEHYKELEDSVTPLTRSALMGKRVVLVRLIRYFEDYIRGEGKLNTVS